MVISAKTINPFNFRSTIVPNPLIVSPDTIVLDAITQMNGMYSQCDLSTTTDSQINHSHTKARASCLLVVEHQKLVGIFTERDVINLITQQKPLNCLRIGQVMVNPVITLSESAFTNLFIASNLIQKHQIRHLPILNEQESVIGMVTPETLWFNLEQQMEPRTANRKLKKTLAELEITNAELPQNPTDLKISQVPFLKLESEKLCHQDFFNFVNALTEINQTKETETLLKQQNHILERLVKERTAELQNSEQRYRALMDGASDAILLINAQGNLIEMNRRAESLFGYSRAEITQQHISQLYPGDAQLEINNYFNNVIMNHFSPSIESSILRKDGSHLPVEITASRIDLHGEQITQGIFRDISDRKQTEIALQESRRFIEQIADSSPNILYLYDVQEKMNIYVNRQIFTILGYSTEAIQQIGKNLDQELIHPEDRISILPTYYQRLNLAKDGEIIETEYRMRHANQEWHWLYSRDVIFSRDDKGRVKQIIGTAENITERKRLEQAQNRLIAILEASTDYILIADTTGATIWNNTTLKKLRCLDSHLAVMRQRVTDYHPPSAVELIEKQAIPAAIANGSWLGENILLDAQGKEIPVSQLLIAHKSSQGEVEFFSTIMRDMRIHKAYEQKLEQTNAELLRATHLKDEFLANMSHELRTPLNAILGITEGLQDQVFGPVNIEQIRGLQIIERSGFHLLALINDILDVAKIESGQIDLDCTPTSVALLCQSSQAFIKQQALKKRIQLEMKFPANLPDLLVDERRIRQVLINLLNNAVKFTPFGGRITLEVKRIKYSPPIQVADLPSPDYLQIAVIDTGIGIAPENIDRLFQPFIQIDSALNREYTGTGLGLSLVKRIVELHGGKVGLTSEVGVGSCFTIELPCHTSRAFSPELETQPELFQKSNQSQLKISPLILLAEDNEANISTVSSYLKAKGYRLLLAKNGEEAIALAQSEHPDLILMDIQMPSMDGLEAIKHIRDHPNLVKLPIIALTALAMTGDRELCLEAGANDYLTKPVKLKQLANTIQQFLA